MFDLRPTTIKRAFLLNALILAIITALSIELRHRFDKEHQTKGLAEWQKLLLTVVGSFMIIIFMYIFGRAVFGLGGGMLVTKKYSSFF